MSSHASGYRTLEGFLDYVNMNSTVMGIVGFKQRASVCVKDLIMCVKFAYTHTHYTHSEGYTMSLMDRNTYKHRCSTGDHFIIWTVCITGLSVLRSPVLTLLSTDGFF